MNKKKKIIAIVLVFIVLLLGGASIYVATQLSTKQAVAPNAPESEPMALEPMAQTPTPVWVGSPACTVEAIASDPVVICTPDGTKTCIPDCPTECGIAVSTITTCKDSCYEATTKACPATAACPPETAVLIGNKLAFKNVTANTPGKYTLTTEMETVSKSQIYVYSIELTNTSTTTANGVVIKDSLKDIVSFTYMDTISGCSWSTTNKELTCNTTIKPDETKTFEFRVKASDGIVNGDVLTNTAKVTLSNGDPLELKKDLTVSTVVSCNHTCTTDEECATGLTCDTTTSKCRLATCITEDDCVCAVAPTRVPYVPTATKAVVPTATKAVVPTRVDTIAATPATLPDTGIFDLPGVAAFGGGLILAIVGILLAL